MPDPSPFTPFDFGANWHLISSLEKLCVANFFWPSNSQNVSQAFVYVGW
jgi:hypothetical protein